MREIKFRAWDKKNKKMITWHNEDASYCVALNGEIKAIQHGSTPFNVILPKSLQLMRYTGLADRNGDEVWEDDWLRMGERVVGPVFYSTDRAAFCVSNDHIYLEHMLQEGFTVCGNRHENPELLGK